MQQYEALAHCQYQYQYQVAFNPRFGKKALYGRIRKRGGPDTETALRCDQKRGIPRIRGARRSF